MHRSSAPDWRYTQTAIIMRLCAQKRDHRAASACPESSAMNTRKYQHKIAGNSRCAERAHLSSIQSQYILYIYEPAECMCVCTCVHNVRDYIKGKLTVRALVLRRPVRSNCRLCADNVRQCNRAHMHTYAINEPLYCAARTDDVNRRHHHHCRRVSGGG